MAALFACSCIQPKIDKPLAPETDELAELYAAPPGELTAEMMEPMVAEVEATVSSTGGLCGWADIDSLLCADPDDCNAIFTCKGLAEARALADQVRELILDSANGDDTVDTEEGEFANPFKQAEGFATIRHRCPGLGDMPTLDEANGDITMTAGFTNLSLDPVIWAELDGCQTRVLAAPFAEITVTGTFLVALSDAQVTPDSDITFLIAFDLQIETELGTADIAASFLLEPDESRISILIRGVGDVGDVLFFSGPNRAGFITRSGEYACDFTGRRCIGPGGEELTW